MPESEPRESDKDRFTQVLYDAASQLLIRGISPKNIPDLLNQANALGISHEKRRIVINNGTNYHIERRGSAFVLAQYGRVVRQFRDDALKDNCKDIAEWVYAQ